MYNAGADTHTYVYVHARAHTHTHTNTHARTHTHTHTQREREGERKHNARTYLQNSRNSLRLVRLHQKLRVLKRDDGVICSVYNVNSNGPFLEAGGMKGRNKGYSLERRKKEGGERKKDARGLADAQAIRPQGDKVEDASRGRGQQEGRSCPSASTQQQGCDSTPERGP